MLPTPINAKELEVSLLLKPFPANSILMCFKTPEVSSANAPPPALNCGSILLSILAKLPNVFIGAFPRTYIPPQSPGFLSFSFLSEVKTIGLFTSPSATIFEPLVIIKALYSLVSTAL